MENQRFILENVPRVNFFEGGKRCPEDIILPSVMRSILEYLGEEDYDCKHCPVRVQNSRVFCTYSFLVGVSGAAEHLLHAAACYAAEHDLMWQVWDLIGGIDNPEAFRAMADTVTRRAIVRIIHQAREKDAQAAVHFEQALHT